MTTVIGMLDSYPIEAVDLSTYQDYTATNVYTPINFQAAKQTRASLRWMLVKLGEGNWEGYPVEVFRRQLGDAQRAGFDVSAYLYHHMEARPADMANYVAKRTQPDLTGNMPLAVDFEDEDLPQFKHPLTVLTSEQMIARKGEAVVMHNNMRDTLDAISQLQGAPAIGYTGAYYCDWFLYVAKTYGGCDLSWMNNYWWWLSTYRTREMWLPYGMPLNRVLLWQYTSSPPLTQQVAGFPNPARLDMNYFIRDQASYDNLRKGAIPVTTALWNTATPQAKRARVVRIRADQAIKAAPADLGADLVILPMGGMTLWDGSHQKCFTESTFPGRFDLIHGAGIPIIGEFALDGGLFVKEQHVAAEFENRVIRDNWVLPFLLNAWHDGPWSWDSVLAKQGKWRPVVAISLGMTETDGYPTGSTLNDDWQARTFQYVVNHLKLLMDNGQVPNVPILLYTGPWWLELYPNQMANAIQARKTWLWLHLGQWVLQSTATFPTLKEILAFGPPDDFKFGTAIDPATGKPKYTYPDGFFQRILLHEYSGQHQKCDQLPGAAVELSAWQDEAAAMKAFFQLNSTPDLPPVDPGNTDLKAVQGRLAELEEWMASQSAWSLNMQDWAAKMQAWAESIKPFEE